ncbi:MAG TPA: M23 family metallopeptidase [Longimicrobiales bacterium]|nr:M23 family metallopeptidase [Longimicrobiales bacterium]
MRARIAGSSRSLAGVLLLAGCLFGCDAIEQLPGFEPPLTPHQAYARGLAQAGLTETALGREWLGAAQAALAAPVRVSLPIQESGYLAPDRPRAVAYQVHLARGRRITLQAELTPHPGALLFIDVFAVPESPGDSLDHQLAADSGSRSLAFEPRRTGDYVIRLQPELLRGGRYRLTLRAQPALAFPVQGRPNNAIRSGFGAPRDGGARDHHGIDIFAPRGTPVIAVADGQVTRVRETERGGRVVWIRDERRGLSLYYAHLDRQLVDPGASVTVGDTIGLVGNTGNARTTPPHLHFGIYRRGEGPLDPYPWVARINTRPEPMRGDLTLVGQLARTRRASRLRAAPAATAEVIRMVDAQTIVQVLSTHAAWYHTRLPDGASGFLSIADAAPARPIRTEPLARATELRAGPLHHAEVIDTIRSATVEIYGRFGDYWYARSDSLAGWINLSGNGR